MYKFGQFLGAMHACRIMASALHSNDRILRLPHHAPNGVSPARIVGQIVGRTSTCRVQAGTGHAAVRRRADSARPRVSARPTAHHLQGKRGGGELIDSTDH